MFKLVILLINIRIFIIISKEFLFCLIMCYLFDLDFKKKILYFVNVVKGIWIYNVFIWFEIF